MSVCTKRLTPSFHCLYLKISSGSDSLQTSMCILWPWGRGIVLRLWWGGGGGRAGPRDVLGAGLLWVNDQLAIVCSGPMSVTAVVEPMSCCGFSTLILLQCVIFTLPVICLVTGGFPRAKLVFRRVFPQRQGVAGRPSHGPVCTSMALAVRWIGLDRVRSGSTALVSVCLLQPFSS